MAAPTTTSLRGLETKYFFHRETGFADPQASVTRDTDAAAEGESEETSTYVTNCFAGAFWTYDSDATEEGEHFLCMTYNPITDQYAIREGQYVL